MIQRSYFETIARRIDEPRKFIQIIEGPRFGPAYLPKAIPSSPFRTGRWRGNCYRDLPKIRSEGIIFI